MLNDYRPWRSVDQRLWWKYQTDRFIEQARQQQLLKDMAAQQRGMAVQQQNDLLRQAWAEAVQQAQPKKQDDGFWKNLRQFDLDDAALDALGAGGKAVWKVAKPVLTVLDAPAEYAVQPFAGTILKPYTTQKVDKLTGQTYRTVDWKRMLDDLTGIDEVIQSAAKGDIKGLTKALPGSVMPFGTQMVARAGHEWVSSLMTGDFEKTWSEGRQVWKQTLEENPILQRKAPGLIMLAELLTDPTMYIGPGLVKAGLTKLPKALQVALGGKAGIGLIDNFLSTPALATLGVMVASPAATQLAHELDLPAPVRAAVPFVAGIAGAGVSQKLAAQLLDPNSLKGESVEQLVERLRSLRNPEALAKMDFTIREYAAAREQLEEAIKAMSKGQLDKAAILPPATVFDEVFDAQLNQMFGGLASNIKGQDIDTLYEAVLNDIANRIPGIKKGTADAIQKMRDAKLELWTANDIPWDRIIERFREGASWYSFYPELAEEMVRRVIPRDVINACLTIGGWNRQPDEGLIATFDYLAGFIELTKGGADYDSIFGPGATALIKAGDEIPVHMLEQGREVIYQHLKAQGISTLTKDHASALLSMLLGYDYRPKTMRMKLSRFGENMRTAVAGDYSPSATIDVHAVRPLGYPDVTMPFVNETDAPLGFNYLFVERFYQHIAAEHGVTPSEMQASLWGAWRDYGDQLTAAYAKEFGHKASQTVSTEQLMEWAKNTGRTFERFVDEVYPYPGYSMAEVITNPKVAAAVKRLHAAASKYGFQQTREAGVFRSGLATSPLERAAVGETDVFVRDVKPVVEAAPELTLSSAVLQAAKSAEGLGIVDGKLPLLQKLGIPHSVSVGGIHVLRAGLAMPDVSIKLPGRNAAQAKHVAAFLANQLSDATGSQQGVGVIAKTGTANALAVRINSTAPFVPGEIGSMLDGTKAVSVQMGRPTELRIMVDPGNVDSLYKVLDNLASSGRHAEANISVEAVNTAVVPSGLKPPEEAALEGYRAIEEQVQELRQQGALPLERHAERSPHTALKTARNVAMSKRKLDFLDSLPAEIRAIDGMATFVASLPEWVLDRLEIVKAGAAEGGVVASYDPKTAMLRISADVLSGKVDDPMSVVMHEVAHHIEAFFTDDELEQLAEIWRREMSRGGWKRAKQYADAIQSGDVSKLPLEVRQQLDAAYRHGGGFREWVAERMVDYFTGRKVDIPRGTVFQQVVDFVRSIVLSIASAMRLTDRPQTFDDIVGRMLESDFRRAVSGRNIDEFPFRKGQSPVVKGAGAKQAVAAAAPMIKYGRLSDDMYIPGTRIVKTSLLAYEDVHGAPQIVSYEPDEFEKTVKILDDVVRDKFPGYKATAMDDPYASGGFSDNITSISRWLSMQGTEVSEKEVALLMADMLEPYMKKSAYFAMRYAFELLPNDAFENVNILQEHMSFGTMAFYTHGGFADWTMPYVSRQRDTGRVLRHAPYQLGDYKIAINPLYMYGEGPATDFLGTVFHEFTHHYESTLSPNWHRSGWKNWEKLLERVHKEATGGKDLLRVDSRTPGGRIIAKHSYPGNPNYLYALHTPAELTAVYSELFFLDQFVKNIVPSNVWQRLVEDGKLKNIQQFIDDPEGYVREFRTLAQVMDNAGIKRAYDDVVKKMLTRAWEKQTTASDTETMANHPIGRKIDELATAVRYGQIVPVGEETLMMRRLASIPGVDTNDLFNMPTPEQMARLMSGRTKGAEGRIRSALAKVPLLSRLDPNITRDSDITPFAIDARNRIWNMIDSWEAHADFLWGKLEDAGLKVEFRDGNFWIGDQPAGDVFEAVLGSDKSPAASAVAAALSQQQVAAIRELGAFNRRVNATLMKYVQPSAAGETAEAVAFQTPFEEAYFPRVVVGKDGKPRADFSGVTAPSAKIGTHANPLEDRAYLTMFEGQDVMHINYADPEQAYRTMVRAKLAAAGSHYIAGALKRVAMTEEQVFAAGGLPGVTHYDLGQYIPALSGVYFTEEQATRILSALRGRPGFEIRAVRELNSMLTPIRAMGDISWLGQQGAYVLFRHPIKAVKAAIKVIIASLGNPEKYRQLLQEEVMRGAARLGMTYDEYMTLLVTNGLHQVADDLGEIGIGFTSTGGVAGWRHYKKFSNETFGRYLNWARVALANDAVERAAKTGNWDELAGAIAAVNRATGWTGRQPTSLESLLMFAPRFLSAAVEQTFAAVTKGGLEGSIARRHIATLLGTGAVISIGLNAMRGYDTELDPRSPNFLRIRNVGGLDVSLLGTYNTLFRMLARVATGDREAVTRFMESKLSPAVAMIYFPARGRTYLGEPIGLDNPANLAYQYGKTMIPFPAQALVEEGIEPAIEERDPMKLVEAAPNQLASGMGFAASPMTPAERRDFARTGASGGLTFGGTQLAEGPVSRDGVAQEMFGKPYDELTAKEKSQVNRDPRVDYWTKEAEKNKLTRADPFAMYTKQKMEAAAQIEALGQRLLAGEITGNEYRDRYQIIQAQLSGARDALGIKSEGKLGEWFGLYEKARRADGSVDYDKLEKLQAEFREKNPDIDDLIAKEVGTRDDPVQQMYREAQKQMAKYQKIPIYAGLTAKQGVMAQQAIQQAQALVAYGRAPDIRTALRMLRPRLGIAAYLGERALGMKANPARALYRANHPLLGMFYSEAGALVPPPS